MLIPARKKRDRNYLAGCGLWRVLLMAAAALATEASIAGDGLWVDNPEEVTFSVADMTPHAKDMGLTGTDFATTLSTMLNRAGLRPRRSESASDSDVLFLDIVVQDETFYASLGFWRRVSYPLPNGATNSEFVTVWQDYSVGAHHDDPGMVRATVNSIIERFITKYHDANEVGTPLRIAAKP